MAPPSSGMRQKWGYRARAVSSTPQVWDYLAPVRKPVPPPVTITIDHVPTDYPSEVMAKTPISGTVTGEPKGSRIVVFALGDVWYVQPLTNRPFTDIENGKWRTPTHGGFEFAVLVVLPGYQPPATTTYLPDVGDLVVAIKRAKPK